MPFGLASWQMIAEVEGAIVLDDTDFGVLGGLNPVEGRVLPELRGRHGVLPHRLVENPVDLDCVAAGYHVHIQLGGRRKVRAVVVLRPHRPWQDAGQTEQNQSAQKCTGPAATGRTVVVGGGCLVRHQHGEMRGLSTDSIVPLQVRRARADGRSPSSRARGRTPDRNYEVTRLAVNSRGSPPSRWDVNLISPAETLPL